MTGQDLIDAIKKYHMENVEIDADGSDDGTLTFPIRVRRNPNDDEEVQYTDFKIDLETGEGKEVTWGDEF